ncbi:MAG: sulfur carrier protein ThiS adenylyltransferase ThiF [Candidatus Cloacimonetes bacterium]|nr:sulfur carrier protein ThiS adenylyltransferase ThiF [Candidatus Cloacimonadota bacterium]MBT6994810.1 sulfur carrier protein ThiS adenylyltransferase ThiF [Candidatus Cloacimonadota bacterium]MBT7470182.1 sulfur carrier protein ThiS adenylyltransferase ThiF [Candidatus Cloacimonadota bacterium]
MQVFVNEKIFKYAEISLFELHGIHKKDADVIILNGFPTNENAMLKDGDKVTLIKRGEVLSEDELENLMMARHTPQIHEKLKQATVAIAGLGGLGSNVAISLARIGVGKLILIDFDVVEPSNLNRQQYYVSQIGMRKTEALKLNLMQINPFITYETHNVYVTENNVENLFNSADIIVEAFDVAENKAMLINNVLSHFPAKKIIAASGMAGSFSSNLIQTKRPFENLYLVGDEVNEATFNCGLMAPRVAIAANHQANMVLRLIIGDDEV